MAVVQIRIVGMRVDYRIVSMPMCMRLSLRVLRIMIVLMMLVVPMGVLMLRHLMSV